MKKDLLTINEDLENTYFDEIAKSIAETKEKSRENETAGNTVFL